MKSSLRTFFSSFSKTDYIFFALCSIAFYLLIRQYIPCVEDLYYIFSSATGEYLTSFKDVIISQAHDYMHINGRFLVHCIVQYMCAISGPIPFYIISSLSFGSLIMGLTWLVRHQTNLSLKVDKYLLVLSLLFFIPQVGMTYLGHIAHVANYLWGSAVYVWFLCLYLYINDSEIQYKWWQTTLLCLFAFVAGTFQESFSIGIAGALFLYHIFTLKDTKGTLLYFLLAFAIGTCIGFFAPGNFARFFSGMDSNSHFVFTQWLSAHIYQIKMLFKHCPPITIFTLLLVFIGVIKRKNTLQCLRKNYILLMPCLLMSIFGVFIAFSGERQFVIIGLLSSVVLVCLLIELLAKLSNKVQNVLLIISLGTLIGLYIPIFQVRSQLVKANDCFEQSILNSQDSIAYSTEIEEFSRCQLGNSFFRNYTNLYFISTSFEFQRYVREYSQLLYPDHKVHITVALPENKDTIISHCTTDNILSDYVFISPKYEYIIVRIPQEWEPTETTLVMREVSISKIDKMKDILMRRVNRPKERIQTLTSKTFPDHYRYFINDEYRYVIVSKSVDRKLVEAYIQKN